MSSQQPEQATQQAAGGSARQEIEDFFKQAGALHTQPRLRGVAGVCRFDISGAGSWDVAVNDGEVSVIEGAGNALRPDCVVSCGAEDFLRILHRDHYLNLLTAAMQGLVTVTGDKVFSMALLGNVVAAPVAAVSQG